MKNENANPIRPLMMTARKPTRPRSHLETRMLGLVLGAWLMAAASAASATATVALITDSNPGPAAAHGLETIQTALKRRGIKTLRANHLDGTAGGFILVAGLAKGTGPAAAILGAEKIQFPDTPEALLIRLSRTGPAPRLLVAGADDRGLMYAELEIADRVLASNDSTDPFHDVRDTLETPYVRDRALSIYTMQQRYFEGRLHDPEYWTRYFDLLARSRFNRFVVIFGYENGGYMAPPYPYFFDVPGFETVSVVGLSPTEQQHNLASLRRMISIAHERGIEFTVAIWDHIYRGGVQTGGVRKAQSYAHNPVKGLVHNLTQENLMSYSAAAVKTLLTTLPGVDSIQFRMHGESGLKRGEMADFWRGIYQAVKDTRGEIRLDARAKNFPDSLIDLALEMGVNLRLCTKYWMEQMGLPFHPTHIHPRNQHDRRHGYADLLRYPKRYNIHWRLWNGGTTRVLLWGDPEYARRFAKSTLLYNGDGFEVNEPLATKMEAQPQNAEPFELLNPKLRFYRYEFERYWHFYQSFGRMGYNPRTPPEIWDSEFRGRFGRQAGPIVERALHRASWVLPMAVAYCYPYRHFPTTRGWIEHQRQEDLDVWSKALPSDTEQFLGPDQAARLYLAGRFSAKRWPEQSAQWFAQTAADILRGVTAARQVFHGTDPREFNSTLTDLRILAGLAAYHAHRSRAGYDYALFHHSRDLNLLDQAMDQERQAIGAWNQIVEAAGDSYAPNLAMGWCGADLCGHWRDELVLLRKGLDKLRRERRAVEETAAQETPAFSHVPVKRVRPGEPLRLRATLTGSQAFSRVGVRLYRPGADPESIKLHPIGKFRYETVVPPSRLAPGMSYSLEAHVRGGDWIRYTGVSGKTRMPVAISDDLDPPRIFHRPIERARAGEPLTVMVRVRDRAGVGSVRLRYRSLTQFEDYQTLEMQPQGGDIFSATIPGEAVKSGWDFMYFIEAWDSLGNGTIHPNLEDQTPYYVVRLKQ